MRPRKTLRIARWEVQAAAGQYDRRTLVLALVGLVLVAGLTPLVADKGLVLDRGLYVAGVEPGNPYYDPIAADETFVAVPPDRAALERGDLDLLVRDDVIVARDDRAGRAAAAELANTVEHYNDALMRAEPDRAAAFPVTVNVRYVERDLFVTLGRGSGGGGDSGSGGGSGGGAGSDGGGSGTGPVAAGGESLPAVGGPGVLDGRTSGSPSDIAPPFPFGSLVLAFAFLVPMNFVVQAYGSSMLRERLNHRGEALLVAPVTRFDVIAGKTLPYLVGMLAIAAATAVAIGGGLVSLAAVLPVVLVFLGSTFLGAMLARSFKELTFVTVAISVGLTSYVFVPAIFTNVHPIAAISPLTLVVKELEGTALVGAGEYAFATLPFYLAAAVLFGLGAGLYREEDLFAQRPLAEKAIDAVAWRIRRPRSAAALSALSIPFVLFAELFAIAVLFALPIGVSLPLLLVAVAAIEEAAKSGHVVAGLARGRYDRSLPAIAGVGAYSGFGFFLGEKLAVVTQLVGLPSLDLGRAAFGAAGIGLAASAPVVAALLLAPLALHVATAGITAVGASRGGGSFVGAYTLAVVVHVAYNLAVVTGLG